MSISRKVLLIMSLLVSIFLSADYFVQKKIIFPTFGQIEFQHAKVNIDRIEELFNDAIDNLDRSTYDWSAWDDTYQFIQDGNQKYIDSNLGPSTFGNLQTNFIYFLDPAGKLVWGEVYDITKEETEIITTDTFVKQSLSLLNTYIENIDPRLAADLQFSKGLFVQDDIPVIFSVRPILTSDDEGPMKGYLILGKLFTDELLKAFQERIKIKFKVVRIDPQIINTDLPKDEYEINELSGSSIEISKVYLSNNQPIVKISTIFPRDITRNGLNSINYALSTLLFVGLLSIILIWGLLKITILAPIFTLTRQMLKISQDKDYALRSEIDRDDEIGVLAKEFNRMLSIIERNNYDLEEAYSHIKTDNETIAKAEAELRIVNNELERLTITDPLTGIANRLLLDRKLKDEWNIQRRAQKPISLLMIDIDYFKPFNDHYGHLAGDQCLKQIADILKQCVRRSSDLVARYGGEEFILILPGADIASAINIAENVQLAIAECQIEHLGSKIAKVLTVSIGISSVIPSDKSTIESLVKQADSALYDSKENGRNRFEVAKPNI